MKHIRMSQEHKDLWLNALRSGEYKQNREGYLYHEESDAYCCLGVLQKVIDGDVERFEHDCNSKGFPSIEWLEEHNITFFNADVRITYNPYIELADRNITFLNDIPDWGFTFPMIADILETEIEVVS